MPLADKQPPPCCDENVKHKFILYRKFTHSTGFFVAKSGNNNFWNRTNAESVPVAYCPFCGKDYKRYMSMA